MAPPFTSIILASVVVGVALIYFIWNSNELIYDYSDSQRKGKYKKEEKGDQKRDKKKKEKKLLEKLGSRNKLNFTDDECAVLSNFLNYERVGKFNDIEYSGDLETLKRRVVDRLVSSLKYNNGLLKAPRGILLFGKPGVDITKIGRAIAGESGFRFLNFNISSVMNLEYGKSQRMISALFSLAQKIQPVIIFINEIECFFQDPYEYNSDNALSFRAQFKSKWDNLFECNTRVVVMAASKTPSLIDKEILTRLALQIEISLPDA